MCSQSSKTRVRVRECAHWEWRASCDVRHKTEKPGDNWSAHWSSWMWRSNPPPSDVAAPLVSKANRSIPQMKQLLKPAELAECVDDDTEDHVEHHRDEDHEESELERPPVGIGARLLVAPSVRLEQSLVHVRPGHAFEKTHEARCQARAVVRTLPCHCLDRVHVEAPDCVNVDNDGPEAAHHCQLVAICGDRTQDLLQRGVVSYHSQQVCGTEVWCGHRMRINGVRTRKHTRSGQHCTLYWTHSFVNCGLAHEKRRTNGEQRDQGWRTQQQECSRGRYP
eukprot:1134040-Prymnesium_polylepis.2